MKITQVEFGEFLKEYYGKPGHLRLGQAFCNKFNITDSDLFYCANNDYAMDKIVVYLIKEVEA